MGGFSESGDLNERGEASGGNLHQRFLGGALISVKPHQELHVGLFGHINVRVGEETRVRLPRAERAVLVFLCAIGRPIRRSELMDGAAISSASLGPVLSRLPRSLNVNGRLHIVAGGGRSEFVELNRDMVSDDGELIQRALGLAHPYPESLLALSRAVGAPPLLGSGLVFDHPTVAEAIHRLTELRQELGDRVENIRLLGRDARVFDLGRIVGPILAKSQYGDSSPDSDSLSESVLALLISRAETNVRLGSWDNAASDFLAALESVQRSADLSQVAELALQLARITWNPELGAQVDRILSGVVLELDDPVLVARVRICLAGGTYQGGVAGVTRTMSAQLRTDLGVVRQAGKPLDMAWAALGVRDALATTITAKEALSLADEVIQLDVSDCLAVPQARRARFVDLLRADRRGAALSTLLAMEHERADPGSAVNSFGLLTARNSWDLALGRLGQVQAGLARLLDFRGRLGDVTLNQVVMGQSFWLSREVGDAANLRLHFDGALTQASVDQSTPLWRLAAAVMAADLGDHDRAMSLLDESRVLVDLSLLPAGRHRTGMLCFVAEVLSSASVAGFKVLLDDADRLYNELAREPDEGVMFGWPTVFVGSKERFLGFSALAGGRRDRAQAHLARAMWADRRMPALYARSLQGMSDACVGEKSVPFRLRAAEIRRKLRLRFR